MDVTRSTRTAAHQKTARRDPPTDREKAIRLILKIARATVTRELPPADAAAAVRRRLCALGVRFHQGELDDALSILFYEWPAPSTKTIARVQSNTIDRYPGLSRREAAELLSAWMVK